MRIELKNDTDGSVYQIVGYCSFYGHEQSVISFTYNKYHTLKSKWSTSSSTCLPSDIAEAKVVMDCYNLAYAELEKHL